MRKWEQQPSRPVEPVWEVAEHGYGVVVIQALHNKTFSAPILMVNFPVSKQEAAVVCKLAVASCLRLS